MSTYVYTIKFTSLEAARAEQEILFDQGLRAILTYTGHEENATNIILTIRRD